MGKLGADYRIWHKEDHTRIHFLETNNWLEWILHFLFAFRKIPYKAMGRSKIKVHAAWIELYKAVRFAIIDEVAKNKKKQVVVSGYSMGGALAYYCAVDLQYTLGIQEITVKTLGSPRPGNKYFKKSYERRVPRTYSYRAGKDVVTLLPPFYSSVGIPVKLGKKAWWKLFSLKDHASPLYLEVLDDLD